MTTMSGEAGSILRAPSGLVPEDLSDTIVERLRTGSLELPLLPEVATQILNLARTRDVDALRLADVLQRDQALAGHVMRLANSAAYAARIPIVSLQQAISRLGLATLRDMVVAVAVRGKVFSIDGCADLVNPMWTHALATAYWAKEIARARRSNVEVAFLCGLLHDVGSPVVLQAILDAQRAKGMPYSRSVIQSAIEHFHCVVGSVLVAEWNMPSAVADSICYHHDYALLDKPSEIVMVTQLADMLAEWMGAGHGAARTQESIERAKVIEDLNIYPDELTELLAWRERIQKWVEDVKV